LTGFARACYKGWEEKANPIAAVLSAAMLLECAVKAQTAAAAIEAAVVRVLDQGYRTPDIVQPGSRVIGTREMGDRIAEAVSASPGTEHGSDAVAPPAGPGV
jgi:isocitrate/isopropylmalate dehydrogenase